jgi:hypothetical protein
MSSLPPGRHRSCWQALTRSSAIEMKKRNSAFIIVLLPKENGVSYKDSETSISLSG